MKLLPVSPGYHATAAVLLPRILPVVIGIRHVLLARDVAEIGNMIIELVAVDVVNVAFVWTLANEHGGDEVVNVV
jgi:hypothetical protein